MECATLLNWLFGLVLIWQSIDLRVDIGMAILSLIRLQLAMLIMMVKLRLLPADFTMMALAILRNSSNGTELT
jgi:hypothetical protein